MDIGLSSASFYPHINTEDSIGQMKKLNFNCGEIFLNTISEYEEDFIKILNEKRIENAFNIYSVHSFSSAFEPYLFDGYKRRAQDMMKNFTKLCKAASILGATCYTFHGLRYEPFENMNKKRVLDGFNELVYIAHENGIKLAQENVSWCMSSNLEYLKFLKDTCKYPIYFTLDIKQAYKAGISPYKYIEVMGDRIINFHVNDRDEKHICLLPGKGSVNYLDLVNKLHGTGYNGIGIIEVYNENYKNFDELTQAKEFLDSLINL